MTPISHLRLAGRGYSVQSAALRELIGATPHLMTVLRGMRALGLPEWWMVSGALYNQAWNTLTGRPDLYGVKDIDLFYFDPDTRFEAEDRQIRRAAALLPDTPPVELRNQARVHLWYERHFGHPYPALGSAREGVDRFAATTHAVAVRLEADDRLTLYAPYGLEDVFSFTLRPNPILPNRTTYERKAARQKGLWPELTVLPWPEAPTAPAPLAMALEDTRNV